MKISLAIVLLFASATPGLADGDFLYQPPDNGNCDISDWEQSLALADNFTVSEDLIQIDQLVVWGVYMQGNVPGVDDFSVRFMVDSEGQPGANAAPPESHVPSARIATGEKLWGSYDLYRFTLTLVAPVSLDPGIYWVEVMDAIPGSDNDFCWVTGTLDVARGIARHARRTINGWTSLGGERSLVLNGIIVPVELESFEIER